MRFVQRSEQEKAAVEETEKSVAWHLQTHHPCPHRPCVHAHADLELLALVRRAHELGAGHHGKSHVRDSCGVFAQIATDATRYHVRIS
jgi:hypothetical protein